MRFFLGVFALLAALSAPASAAVTGSGNISPATDPSTWSGSTTAYVGYASAGAIAVNDGSDLVSGPACLGWTSGATGSVAVDGSGSAWVNIAQLWVGYNGGGTLAITNGAAVTNPNQPSYVGFNSGATGTVNVDGSGSSWTNAAVNIGVLGSGALNVAGGGAVKCSSAAIGGGQGAVGAVAVDGSGSVWTNSGNLVVGNSGGAGTLNVSGGGAVSSAIGYVGFGSGSTGTVTVDGPGSTWTSNAVWLGNSGAAGTLNVSGGGAVEQRLGLRRRGLWLDRHGQCRRRRLDLD